MVLEPGEAPGLGGGAGVNNQLPLEALLGGRGGFAPMLEIPPEADDEAMMELAIALSLQEQSNQGGGGGLNLQALGLGAGVQGQSSSSLEEGPLSDTTASGGFLLQLDILLCFCPQWMTEALYILGLSVRPSIGTLSSC